MTSNTASGMMDTLCQKVGLVSLFWRVKHADDRPFAVNAKACFVRLPSSRHIGHTQESKLVILFRALEILKICLLTNIAQVRQAIIRSVAVDMVDHSSRPNAVNMKPDQSMGRNRSLVDNYLTIAIRDSAACRRCTAYAGSLFEPKEVASIGVVGERSTHKFGAKLWISHDDSLIVGLVRACIALQQRRGLVYFTAEPQ